jgi:hypothetical protein
LDTPHYNENNISNGSLSPISIISLHSSCNDSFENEKSSERNNINSSKFKEKIEITNNLAKDDLK